MSVSSRSDRRWPGGASTGNENLQGLARGGGLNLVGAVINQVSLFGITALLAIPLGKTDVGRYATCFALLSLLGLLSLVGFRAAMTRFVAIYLADRDAARLRGTVRLGLWLSLGSSLVLGAGLAYLAPTLAGWFSDPGLEAPLRLTGLALPATTMADAALAGTQGWRTQRPFTYIGRIFDPLSRFALTGVLLFLGMGVVGALWALVVTSYIAAALALRSLLTRLAQLPRATPTYPVREIFSFSMVSWVSAMAATGLIWTDTLLIGWFQDTDQVGIYSVATRIVTLAVFVMAPINAAFGPHLAHLHHLGDLREMGRMYQAASAWIVRLALPAFVVLVLFPANILGVFGPDFATGAAVTAVLAIGQFINAATGPCGTVLNMSGRVKINMIDNIAVLALNISLNLILIPRIGIIGAAIAWSVSLGTVNLVRVYQVKRFIGIAPWSAGMAKAVLAAAVAAAGGFVIRETVDGSVLSLLLGAVVVALLYAGTTLVLGVSSDEKTVLRGLRRSGRPTRAGQS